MASHIAERRDRKMHVTKTNQHKYHKRPCSVATVFWQWNNDKHVLDQQVLDYL